MLYPQQHSGPKETYKKQRRSRRGFMPSPELNVVILPLKRKTKRAVVDDTKRIFLKNEVLKLKLYRDPWWLNITPNINDVLRVLRSGRNQIIKKVAALGDGNHY
ncbi:MAG: hypothetical protein R3218_01160 [Christiangramia sp.]|nr:hypothetical protein [Christiangramia sp.]